MLAQNNNYFREASETVYELTQEEQIRQQCLAREDYNRTMKGIENKIAKIYATTHSHLPIYNFSIK